MSTGAVIFAYNNEHIDYVAMAAWSAQNIRRHLEIPVCLITDQLPSTHLFDHVVVVESHSNNSRNFSDIGTVTWHNTNRMDAYYLSPWDQTLVLDADYVVASDQLKSILAVDQDFLAHRWAYDVTGINDFSGLNYFGQVRMPMWWATVMMFRRSQQAELIFDCMAMIRKNWDHYRALYKNNVPTYRNDHALSIALGTVNGHVINHHGIPWNLASLTPEHKLTQIDQDCYRVEYKNTENKLRWIELTQDFHAMGKQQLLSLIHI